MNELDVVGVRVEMPSNQPLVLLRESEGDRYLPIWIGAAEAAAIAFAQQGVVPPRPLTHDLLRDVVESLGQTLDQVRISDLREGVFYAELVFSDGTEVSARPSDAIALALRTGSPIFVEDAVLDVAGQEPVEEGQGAAEGEGEPPEEILQEFRAFIEDVNPEDFAS